MCLCAIIIILNADDNNDDDGVIDEIASVSSRQRLGGITVDAIVAGLYCNEILPLSPPPTILFLALAFSLAITATAVRLLVSTVSTTSSNAQ